MSLTSCMKKAGTSVDPDNKKSILKKARQYRALGSSPDDAGRKALDDQIAAVEDLIKTAQNPPKPQPPEKANGPQANQAQPQQAQQQAAPIVAPALLASPSKQEVIDKQEQTDKAEKQAKAERRAEQERLSKDAERKEIAKASESAADSFTLGGDAMENLTGQGGLQFSRTDTGIVAPMSPNPGATPLYEAMRQLSRFEDSFQTNTSTSKELPDIAAQIVKTGKGIETRQFVANTGTALHQGNRKPTLTLSIAMPNGDTVKLLDIFNADTDRPFVVIGNSDAGQKVGGATAYQIAFAWAHNNGKTMRPDPAGLTVINRLRRTEAMISSAMHYGTTKHLEPHQDQYVAMLDRVKKGGKEPEDTHYSSRPDIYNELEAIKAKLWTTKTDAGSIAANVQHLLESSTQLTYTREPATKNFEVVGGEFRVRSGRDGALSLANRDAAGQVDSKEILGVVLRPAASGVGPSTLRRAAVSGSVMRAYQQASQANNLERQNSGNQLSDVAAIQAIRQTLGKLDLSAPEGLNGLFYSGGAATRTPSTVAKLQAAITELIGGKQLPNQLGRIVVATAADLNAASKSMRLLATVQTSMGRLSHNRQILDSVVKLIPVDVMNDLSSQKLTPKMALDYKPVFKPSGFPVDGQNSIPVVNAARSFIEAVALIATKKPSIFTFNDDRGHSVSLFPAAQASEYLSSIQSRAVSVRPSTGLAAKNIFGSQNSSRASVYGSSAFSTIDSRHSVTPNSDGVLGVDRASTLSTLPILNELPLDAQAFYEPKTKTIVLLADRISEGTERSIILHELMHKYGKQVLGEAGWTRLHSTIKTWADAKPDTDERRVYDFAAARVAAVGEQLSTEELFPYAVEGAIKLGIKPNMAAKKGTVAYWLESVRQHMKMAWDKITAKPEAFKTQDLVDLAFGIAQMENPALADVAGFRGTNEAMTNKDVVGNQGGRSADDNSKWKYHTNEHIKGAVVGSFKGLNVEYRPANKNNNPYDMPTFTALEKNGDVVGLLRVGVIGKEGKGAVEVAPKMRRRGIASTLYKLAEKELGITMRPEDRHTSDAESFWGQPNREFGDNKPTAPDSSGAPMAQTDTPAFKKWFGSSVVTENSKAGGKPMVVYHGTDQVFDQFEPGKSNGMTDPRTGFYFSDKPDAAPLFGDRTVSANLSLKNPLDLRQDKHIADIARKAGMAAQWEDSDGSAKLFVDNGYAQGENFIKAAQKQGFDGLILNDQFAKQNFVSYVAFDAEQIKPTSSSGQGGNIAFARGGNLFQPTIWNTPDTGRMDRFIYEIQDAKVDLRRVQQAITASGQKIEEKWDARLAETLYPGRVAVRSDNFLNAEVKPLLEAMARQNLDMPELADYLHARGAEERNKQIAKVNPKMPDGGAGTNSKGVLMTTQAARDYLAAVTPARKIVLDAMAKRVDTITAGTRSLLVAEGLEKQETVDAWTAAYKNYVPMFRDEVADGFATHPQGSGFAVKGSASKRAMGSTKEVTNILAHVLMQREAAITRAEKNRVAIALYGQAMSHPNPEFWTTIRPGMSAAQISAELVAMGVDPMTAEVGMGGVPTIQTIDPNTGKTVSRPNPMYKTLPGAITLRINGEDRVLMLNVKHERGARLAESLKNLDGLTKLDIAGNIVGKSTRWLASVNTQYNPAFGVVNFTRDVLGGVINLGSTELKGNALKVLAQTLPAAIGIASELMTGSLNGKYGKLYRQFQSDGGQTGFKENFRDPNERAKAIEKELARAGKLTAGRAAHAVLDLLDGFNTTLENAVRLSAYSAAIDKGMSRPQAARLGRELTVDFNRKGRMGRELGPLYAFFNASVQGTARTLEAIKGPTGAKIIAGGLGLGVTQAMMLLAAGYDDDEIPEFVKTRALVIPTNWSGTGEKTHILIPLPLGLHVLPNTGRVLTELVLNGGKDLGKRSVAAIGEIAGAFNPLGGGNVFTADGALKTIAPTLLDPLIEIGFNKNFAGNSIEKESYGGEKDNRPGAARAKEATQRSYTGQAYIGISKAINTAMGGTDYEAGIASPTPERIRYLAQTVGGGVLREIEKTINASVAKSRGETVKTSQIPVVGRFAGEVDGDQVQKSRYYKTSDKVDKLDSSFKAMIKAGDGESANKYLKQNPEVALAKPLDRIQSTLSKLNRQAVQTIGNPEEIKKIDEARVGLMRALNDAVLEIEKNVAKETGATTLGEKIKAAVK